MLQFVLLLIVVVVVVYYVVGFLSKVSQGRTKKCSHCAEIIKENATVCKHCGMGV